MTEQKNFSKTVCPYCGVGCGVILETEKGRVVNVKGDPDHPANKGKLCIKGLNLHRTIHKPDRLMHPMMRDSKDSYLLNVSWDEALDRIAVKFKELINTHGPESIAFHISGQLLTEDYYAVNKLAKGFLKVNNLDSNSRLCMSSAVMGYGRAFGVDAPPCSYDDLNYTDCVFITGSNMAHCHPVLFMQLAELKEEKGDKLKIIVADPRKTATATLADIYLPVKPGTDVPLLNSMLHVIVEEGLVDPDYIDSHVDGYEELRDFVKAFTPEKVSEVCGLSAKDIREAAITFGKANASMTFWAMGLNQSSYGTDKNNALLNLSIVTGNIGKPGAGPFSLTGQANAMGGRETGGLANLIPGHRYMTDEDHRREVEQVWGCDALSPTRGLSAVEIFDGLFEGKIKAVWIICTNPVVSMPNGAKVEEALKRAELVVVQDIFHPTDTSIYADIILPAAGFSEKEGTMTNQERRISYISKAIDPPGEALPDWQIFTNFAHKMGFADSFRYSQAEDIFEEHKLLSKGRDMDITGISYERLKTQGPTQWPCPDSSHPGTSRLYSDGIFHTKTKKAQLLKVDYNPQQEVPDDEYPFVLNTGRLRDQWHTMTKTGKVKNLTKSEPEPLLEMHPKDAADLNIKEGDLVVVESRRGKATVKCAVTDRITQGVVFLPFHWGRLFAENGSANLMTVEAIDEISHQPEFKACSVKVNKKRFDESCDLVIAGNDPIAFDLAKNIHEINKNIKITLISDGSRYSNGTSASNEKAPRSIDTDEKQIRLKDGSSLNYDKLVIAPADLNFLPAIKGISLDGVHVIDSFSQAKKIIAKSHILEKTAVLGSSPVSLQIADILLQHGAKEVNLISPRNVLLDKYLDAVGTELLFHRLKKHGINLFLGAEVEDITDGEAAKNIRLARGRVLEADIIFIETLKRPNLDLALRTGLLVNKGIVVGEHLETSINDIYSLGATVEMKGVISQDHDLLAKQAKVLANLISGDPTAKYNDTIDSTRFNIMGLDILSFGKFDSDDEQSNVMSFLDKGRSVYKKVVIRDNAIVGGLYIGDVFGADEILKLAREEVDIAKYRQCLLSGNLKNRVPIGKILCSCMSVTKEEIESAIHSGMNNIDKLKDNLKVGITCGSCLQEVKDLIKTASKTH